MPGVLGVWAFSYGRGTPVAVCVAQKLPPQTRCRTRCNPQSNTETGVSQKRRILRRSWPNFYERSPRTEVMIALCGGWCELSGWGVVPGRLWDLGEAPVRKLRPFFCCKLGVFISRKEFIKSFLKSRFPHKSVNVLFFVGNDKRHVDMFVLELTSAKRLYKRFL